MSLKSRKILDKGRNLRIKKVWSIEEVMKNEKEWSEVLGKHTNIKPDELINGVISSGFARMTEYHWASLMKEAEDLIKKKTCKDVEINFICHNPSYKYENSKGKIVTKPDLDDSVYARRLNRAQFKHIDIDSKLLIDSSGNSAIYDKKVCYESGETKIESVPKKCNESHSISKSVIDKYKRGPCSTTFNQVTNKYKTTRRLAGQLKYFHLKILKSLSMKMSVHRSSKLKHIY